LANPEVTPYNNVESKREQVETMFDNIAPYYDLMNRVLSLGIDKTWRSKAIKLLQDLESPKILDVATGTCDVAIEMAKNLSNPSIIGLDISAKMLKVGQKKIDKSGLGDIISLTQGESENLYKAAISILGPRMARYQYGLGRAKRPIPIQTKHSPR